MKDPVKSVYGCFAERPLCFLCISLFLPKEGFTWVKECPVDAESKHYHQQWLFLAFVPGHTEVLSRGQCIIGRTVGWREANIL